MFSGESQLVKRFFYEIAVLMKEKNEMEEIWKNFMRLGSALSEFVGVALKYEGIRCTVQKTQEAAMARRKNFQPELNLFQN